VPVVVPTPSAVHFREPAELEGYRGTIPGIAEEASLSLEAGQPLFLVGGFGGCARDIAETLGLAERWAGSRDAWAGFA